MKNRYAARFLALIIAPVIASSALVTATPSTAEAKVEKGSRFPEMSLPYLDGKKKLTNKDLSGKVVLVDFWASWCEPCKISIPFLNDLAKKYKGKLIVVGVNVDEEMQNAKDFLKANPAANIRMVFDEKMEFANKVVVSTMPSSFLLNPKGVVKVAHKGFREEDKAMIESEIKKLLKD